MNVKVILMNQKRKATCAQMCRLGTMVKLRQFKLFSVKMTVARLNHNHRNHNI